MGQYFIIANLDKKQYIHPHDLRCGAKRLEIYNDSVIKDLMSFLSKTSPQERSFLYAGKWVNDKVMLIGDFEDYDLFKQVIGEFKNISTEVYNEYLESLQG